MKIVPASFEILDHLDQQSLAVRIERCGRVCYKSEDKITNESALPFVEKVIKSGHNSVLEMGVVTMEVFCQYLDYVELLETLPKYLGISKLRIDREVTRKHEKTRLLITGSVRAFREMLLFHPDCAVVKALCSLFNERHPYFFQDILVEKGMASIPGIATYKVPLEDVEKLPADLLAKHRHIAVKFVVNRAVSHEICRHRAMAILMESQRYCNYASGKFDGEVTFIRPSAFWDCEITGKSELCVCNNQSGEFCDDCVDDIRNRWIIGDERQVRTSRPFARWLLSMQCAESDYIDLLSGGCKPQAARTVLPNSCKTEIIVYANLEQWRHIFRLRCSKAAEPSMREVMVPLREEFSKRWPKVFRNT